MNGRLESLRFPYLPITIMLRGLSYDLDALLDTGFDGDVIFPIGSIGADLAPNNETLWVMADGSEVRAPLYIGRATLRDLGTIPVTISVMGSEPLVGRNLIRHFMVTLDHGERLAVEP
jgi:predicted aspartyl protease